MKPLTSSANEKKMKFNTHYFIEYFQEITLCEFRDHLVNDLQRQQF